MKPTFRTYSFFFFLIKVQLIYNVLVSGVQHSDSVIYIYNFYTYIYIHIHIYSFSDSLLLEAITKY